MVTLGCNFSVSTLFGIKSIALTPFNQFTTKNLLGGTHDQHCKGGENLSVRRRDVYTALSKYEEGLPRLVPPMRPMRGRISAEVSLGKSDGERFLIVERWVLDPIHGSSPFYKDCG